MMRTIRYWLLRQKRDYAGRIIVPSYDVDNKLNYFLARDFTGNAYLKYKNPPVIKMWLYLKIKLISEPIYFV